MSKADYWQKHSQSWQAGGVSKAAYCASQDIKVHFLRSALVEQKLELSPMSGNVFVSIRKCSIHGILGTVVFNAGSNNCFLSASEISTPLPEQTDNQLVRYSVRTSK
jgi:hypothetical protein